MSTASDQGRMHLSRTGGEMTANVGASCNEGQLLSTRLPDEFSYAATQGRNQADRFIERLDRDTPFDALFARILDSIDRREAGELQPRLRAFCGRIQRALLLARSGS